MKTSTTTNSFTAGEWSPLMLGRSDLPRFQHCAEAIENGLVLIQGGARRRWGTRYLAEVKDSARRVRLMPWVFNETQAYVLELGHEYVRFYTNQTRIEDPPGTPVEYATPWTESQLAALEWTQFGDVAIVTHPAVTPYRIVRISNLLWRVQAAPFVVVPSAESGIQPGSSLTLSALSGAITATSGSGAFRAADVGRQITAGLGVATITAFTSSTEVSASASGFTALVIAGGEWTITDSPQTILTVTGTNTKGGVATLTTTNAALYASYIGDYVRINDGLIELTAYTSSTVMTGRVREIMSSTVAAQAGAWSHERRSWTAARGYPRAVALHDQRVIFGGSPAEPVNLWGSPVGLIYDLSRGVRDAAGFNFQIFGHDMAPIMHLVPAPFGLVTMTASAEMAIGTAGEEPLTPSNFNQRLGSSHGSSTCRPVIAGTDVLFMQRNGLKLRALAYNDTETALWSPDLTWEAEHITAGGITELAHVEDPYPQLYGVRTDGVLVSCALYRQTGMLQHEVLAWARQVTDGAFESVATIPGAVGDDLYLVVNRTIGGAAKRYIEIADDALQVDSAITGSGGPTDTWTGFGHLEGEELTILGDGIAMNPATVIGGELVVSKAVSTIQAGLGFTSKIVIPEIEPQFESFGGSAVAVHEVVVDLVATLGLEIQGNDLRFHRFGPSVLDAAPAPVTGKMHAPNLGWDGGRITLRQIHPYPWLVRRVIRRYTVNDG